MHPLLSQLKFLILQEVSTLDLYCGCINVFGKYVLSIVMDFSFLNYQSHVNSCVGTESLVFENV